MPSIWNIEYGSARAACVCPQFCVKKLTSPGFFYPVKSDEEWDADTVLMICDPEDSETDPNSHDPYPISLIIAKQRNGPRGEIDLTFFPRFTRFESCARVQE